MMATLSRRRMGGRPNTHARGPSTWAALLATRFAFDLVLERLDRDRLKARERIGDERDRPVDPNLSGELRMVRVGRGAVLVGGIDGRIERSETLERAVRHHRNILLCDRTVRAEGSAFRRRR